jgi:glutamine synthetase
MAEAIKLAKASSFAREVLGEEAFDKYILYKEKEEREFAQSQNKEAFYQERYFPII